MMFQKIVVNESIAAQRRIPFYLVDATDGFTPETGITFSLGDIKISKNGAAEDNHTGTVTEVAGGLYYYQAAAGEIDTVGYLTIRFSKAGVRTNVTYIEISTYDKLISAYDGPVGTAIHIDTYYGASGTTIGVNGTINNPVDNLADAVTLATAINIRRYYIIGSITLAYIHQDWEFYGGASFTTVNIGNQNVWGSYFENMDVTGTLDTSGNEGFDIQAENCEISSCVNLTGAFYRCRFHGTIALPTSIIAFSSVGGLLMADCTNVNAFGNPVTINCGGSAGPAYVRAFGLSGEFKFGAVANSSTELDINASHGCVTLLATNTAGNIYYRGGAELVNSVNGATVNISGHYGEVIDDVLGSTDRHGDGYWDNTAEASEVADAVWSSPKALVSSNVNITGLSGNPGQTITAVVQILDNAGERVDGYTATVDQVIKPDGSSMSGYPAAMNEEDVGLFSLGISVPNGVVGSYIVTASWTHPNTAETQYQVYVLNIHMPFGIASVTPA